jgi:two-component system NtrC family sensor kinase
MGWLNRAVASLRLGLELKLALCLVASTAVVLYGLWSVHRHLQRKAFEDLVLVSADRLSDIILRSTRYQMLHNDREALYQSIRNIGAEPGIQLIRIFNSDGVIQFSTEGREVGTVVDKQGEACYACHAAAQPLTKLNRPDRARIFYDGDSNRILAVIRPIENQPACSSSSCHAHPPGRRILGVVDTHLSLASVDFELASQESKLWLSALLAIVVVSLTSVLFVWSVLHGPLKELMAGTQRLAGGDLSYRIPVQSHDELGDLARSFNRMTEQLAVARGEIEAWARTLEDRVEKKTSELERAQSYLISAEKLASLGKLAATVAHEVNNPLAGILTYARLNQKEIEKSALDPDSRTRLTEHLKTIERESRRCGDIIKNLLTFARQTPSNLSPNQINQLVQRAVNLIHHRMDLQEVKLEVTLREDLPLVDCDPGQIQQAALALLVNAGEAMPQGGVLSVSTEWDSESQVARIRVLDTGPGVPESVAPHIFEPFFTTKEDQQRTGLGLAVARSIVEQHAGNIDLVNRPGLGAEFVVTLPLRASTVSVAVPGGNSFERT